MITLENRHTGERLSLRRVKRGDEVWLELKGSLPPRRQGPPMHIHLAEDEEGRVVSGTLSAVLNGRQITAGPGQSVSFPRGAAHRWWNDADEPLHFEGYTRPVVDLDRYLQAVFEVMNAGSEERPPLFYIAHVALRHRRTQLVLIMPKPVQAVLFRVIVALVRRSVGIAEPIGLDVRLRARATLRKTEKRVKRPAVLSVSLLPINQQLRAFQA